MRRPLAVTALATALVLSGTGCFSNDDGGAVGAGSGPATAGLGTQVPAAVRRRGTLRAGVVAARPPLATAPSSGASPTGADVDLITQAASSLGLKLEVVSEPDPATARSDLGADKIDVAFTGKTAGAAAAGSGTTDVGYLADPSGQVVLEAQSGPASLGRGVASAFTAMIADRRYEAILQRWGLTGRALTAVTLNGTPA